MAYYEFAELSSTPMGLPVRLTLILCILWLSGCMSVEERVDQRIVGEWQSSIGGYPVTVQFTRTTVQVAGATPVPYRLDGERLSFANGGNQVRIVSFPSSDEMVQADPMTGTQQHYRRVAGPGS
jgi:hypothetical protein